MFHLVEQAMQATAASLRIAALLKKRADDAGRQWLALYMESERRWQHVWHYIYFLTSGQPPREQHVSDGGEAKSAEALAAELLACEQRKRQTLEELTRMLSGAQRHAAQQAWKQSVEHTERLEKLWSSAKTQAP